MELTKIVKSNTLVFSFIKSEIKTNNTAPKIILIVLDLSPVKIIEIKKNETRKKYI